MKQAFLALAVSLSASAALAGVPPISLPTLDFPPLNPDISTQGCAPKTQTTPCE